MNRVRGLVPRSMRARATVATSALFAVALMISAVGLLMLLRRTMTDNVESTLRLRASDVVGLVAGGVIPERIAIVDEENSFVQVIQNGLVIASSENVRGEPPIVNPASTAAVTMRPAALGHASFRVVTMQTNTSTAETVIVGAALEPVDDTVGAATLGLAVGAPLLLALVAAMTWRVVGRSLYPVEAIRSEVAMIGVTDLHRRVPAPSGDDEIARLAGTMNDMLDRLESGTVRQRRFVSDASHELRTPVATIRHELEVALASRTPVDWSSVAADVLDEDLRMQRLVDDLLWLARHDSAAVAVPSVLVDLDEVVLSQIRRQIGREAGVTIDAHEVGAGQVRGRADDLARVVVNLLDNAVRYARTRVAVSLGSSEGQVALSIDDDGPGVAPTDRLRIFERFTRTDEARDRDHGGAGLGLAIAAGIAVEHGAVIAVTDSGLGGARFTLAMADARSTSIPIQVGRNTRTVASPRPGRPKPPPEAQFEKPYRDGDDRHDASHLGAGRDGEAEPAPRRQDEHDRRERRGHRDEDRDVTDHKRSDGE